MSMITSVTGATGDVDVGGAGPGGSPFPRVVKPGEHTRFVWVFSILFRFRKPTGSDALATSSDALVTASTFFFEVLGC